MKKALILLWLLANILLLTASTTHDFSDNTVIVVLEPEISKPTQTLPATFFGDYRQEQIENLSLIHNEKAVEAIKARGSQYQAIYQITLPVHDKVAVLDTIERLNQIDGVKYASPNYICNIILVPNDEHYEMLWAMGGSNMGGVSIHGIQAPRAWDVSTGSRNIRVGVIDTGVANHPDLEANLTTGYNFRNNTTNTDDTNGHGTHVSGTIGAVGDNEIGVVGVNWQVTIVPLKVSDTGYDITINDLVAAINYATNTWGMDNQISVLNHSISGYGELSNDPRIEAINNYPGLFVWAAGNGGPDQIGDDVDTPFITMYNLDNIIAVGAIMSDGQKTSFSNYSSSGNYVHVFAPGMWIYSTVPGDSYTWNHGTSMAAPHAAGVAALLLSVNPMIPAPQLKQLIMDGADPLTINTPHGNVDVNRLNAYNAIEITDPPYFTLLPTSFNFGVVEINQASQEQTFTITASSEDTFIINSITISGSHESDFNLTAIGLPWTINPAQTQSFTITFSPIYPGNKNASLYIFSNVYEYPYIASLSGRGIMLTTQLPYTQNFNRTSSLIDISWDGLINPYSGIIAGSGVDRTNGLILNVYNEFPTESIYTPTMLGLSAQANISFAYRIVDYIDDWNDYIPETTLSQGDKVFIEVSTTGAMGEYSVIYEINNINHTPSSAFTILNLPLPAYNTLHINIRFRAVGVSGDWCLVIDDVVINNFPPPQSVETLLDINNVTIEWTPPFNQENLIGYVLFRDTALLAETSTAILTYTDQSLALGQYTYSIQAVYQEGLSILKSVIVSVPLAVPYIQDFNDGTSYVNIGWATDLTILSQYSGIKPLSGVDRTNGFVLDVFRNRTMQDIYTPTIAGITEETKLSFAYRIVNYTANWNLPLIAKTLEEGDNVRIVVQTQTPWGSENHYLHEITHLNHTPSIDFVTMELPLSDYVSQPIKIGFWAFWGAGEWDFVFDDVEIINTVANIDEVVVPVVTNLLGNYPNPFNPETVIGFSLAQRGNVSIDIFNLKGQKVRSLVNEVYSAGAHSVVWNGRDEHGRQVGSGVYFYRMSVGEYVQVRKMILLK